MNKDVFSTQVSMVDIPDDILPKLPRKELCFDEPKTSTTLPIEVFRQSSQEVLVESSEQPSWKISLPRKTTDGVLSKKEELFQKNILPSTNDDEIKKFVQGLFQFLEKGYADITPLRYPDNYQLKIKAFQESKKHREALCLMLFAGTLEPVIANDWSIQRTLEEIEAVLGFSIEKTLESYAKKRQPGDNKLIFVDKGAGNGSLINKLRSNPQIASHCEFVGIGHKLLYAPADNIDFFVKERFCKDVWFQKFLNIVLKPFLNTFLEKEWYKTKGSAMEQRLPKVSFFDNNDIFIALANLENIVSETEERGTLKKSIEFPNDVSADMGHELHQLLLEFLGYSPEKIIQKQFERKMFLEDQQKQRLKHKLKVLKKHVYLFQKILDKNDIIEPTNLIDRTHEHLDSDAIVELLNKVEQAEEKDRDSHLQDLTETLTQIWTNNANVFLPKNSIVNLNKFYEDIRTENLVDIKSLTRESPDTILQHRLNLILEGKIVDLSHIRKKIKTGEILELSNVLEQIGEMCSQDVVENFPKNFKELVSFLKEEIEYCSAEYANIVSNIKELRQAKKEQKNKNSSLANYYEKKAQLTKKLAILIPIRNVMNASLDERQTLDPEMLKEKLAKTDDNFLLVKQNSEIFELLNNLIPQYLSQATVLKQKIQHLKKTEMIDVSKEKEKEKQRRTDFLKQYFSSEFVDAFIYKNTHQSGQNSANPDQLDLNLYCNAFPHNFILGRFEEISTFFPRESVTGVISFRSDSHNYKKGKPEKTLEVLTQDGFYSTDAVRDSYLRGPNLPHLEKAILQSGKSAFNLDIIVNGANQDPQAFFVRKQTNNNIPVCFRDDVEQHTPEQFYKQRLDLISLDYIRTNLAEISGSNVDIMREIKHREVIAIVEKVLWDYFSEKYLIPKTIQDRKTFFEDIRKNNFQFADEERKKIWQEITEILLAETRQLIKKTKRAIVDIGFRTYKKELIHTFPPLLENGTKSYRQHYAIHPDKIPKNTEFGIHNQGEQQRQLATDLLKDSLETLLLRIKKPIICPHLPDSDKIIELLERYDLGKYIQKDTNIDFSQTKNIKGIHLRGGYSLDDRQEEPFTNDFFETLVQKDSPVLALFLGSSARCFIDFIAQHEQNHNNSFGIQSGSLELGIYPATIDQTHPLFKNFPPNIAITLSKTTHWIERRSQFIKPQQRDERRKNTFFQPIARNLATGEVLGGDDVKNGKVLALQWNPEISVNHLNDFRDFIRTQHDFHKTYQKFGVTEKSPLNNINVIIPQMQGNPGPLIIFKALNLLARRLIRTLEL